MRSLLLIGLALVGLSATPSTAQQRQTSKQLEEERAPLSKTDLKPTFDAVVECAQRNQEAGCLAARILADKLLDRPFATAICKDTAFTITSKAKVATTNDFDRKEFLLNKATDLLALCIKRESNKTESPSELPAGVKKR